MKLPLLPCAAGLLATLACPAAQADLFEYVKRPEKVYAWKKLKAAKTSAGVAWTLRLTSQTWHGVVWEHDLLVVVPPKATPGATMLLWNQGGKIGPPSIAL